MKILYACTDQTLSESHGGTTHVRAVAAGLARNHQVHLLVQEGAGASIGNVTIHELPGTQRFLLWANRPEIRKLLDDTRPDIVMERYYNFAGTSALEACSRNIPVVLEVNSPMVEYVGSRKQWVDRIFLGGSLAARAEEMARCAALIVAPVKEIVPEFARNKVREIEWGADTELFDPASLPSKEELRRLKGIPASAIVLVHFGSIRKWHGFVDLLEAFDQARPHFPQDVRLLIVGPAPVVKRESVIYAGTAGHTEMPAWLKLSDAAVLPFAVKRHRYLQMAFFWSPLKLFESMAMELPVITLDHPRLREITGIEEAAAFYDGSAQELSRRIWETVRNLNSMKEAAHGLRERVINKYSWSLHVQQLERWISQAAATRP